MHQRITTAPSFTEWATVLANARMTPEVLDCLTYRCHIPKTGNDTFRFKASSAAVSRSMKEVTHVLTQTSTPEHNLQTGQFSTENTGQLRGN